jgi:hypothetical protein
MVSEERLEQIEARVVSLTSLAAKGVEGFSPRSSGWKNALVDEALAEGNAIGKVYLQDSNGDSPDRGTAEQDRTIPAEVPVPLVTAWIEEFDNFLSLFIDSSYIRPLVVVACKTGQAKVRGPRGTAVFPGNDVVNLEREAVVCLRYLAVFAAASGPAPHQLFEHALHGSLVGPGLSIGAVSGLEGAAGLRLQDVEEVPDPLIVVDGFLFLRGERSFPGFGRQLAHPFLVAWAEVEGEKVAGCAQG